MCVYLVTMLYADRFGLGWAHDAFIFACYMVMHFHAYVPSSFYICYIKSCWCFSNCLSLSPSLSLFLMLVASWHLNVNPFHPETLFVSRHLLLLLLLTPLPLTYSSVMRRPNWTSRRTFHDKAFIQNAKSSCQISLTLTYPLSSTVGVGSHFVVSRSHALPWSYRNSTPICTDSITLYPSWSLAFRVYA